MDYNATFTRVLLEAPGDPASPAAPSEADLDAAALAQTMSPEDRAAYDVEGPPAGDAEAAEMIKQKALHWAGQLDSFIAWINGTDGKSLLGQVQSAQKNPGFEGIGDQTQREIIKSATVLAGLKQKINGFINISDSKIERAMAGKD